MSGLLPPPLPELGVEGGRPAATSIGPAGAVIRLGARVVATPGADPVIETAQGRAVLQGAPPLRGGAALMLELPRAHAAPLRTGHLVSVDQQRLESPVPIRLRPAPAPTPAALIRSATGVEVQLRPVSPEGRPLGHQLTARLVPVPEPGSLAPSRPLPPASTAFPLAPSASIAPSASASVQTMLPMAAARVPTAARAGMAPAAPLTLPSAPSSAPSPAPDATAREPAQVLATRNPIEVTVLRRDLRGRVLLGGAGLAFALETPVKLPVGARLQLTFPASPARSEPPLQSGPLEAVRELVAALSEAGAKETVAPGPRLPQASATLAARLLRLCQLIAQHAGATGLRDAKEPAGAETQSRAPRLTAALAELGRLAGEPQNGGWRTFLLPLGFENAPMLRLHLREEPCQDDSEKKRRHGRSRASRRAVFDLEFGELGRCQIDVLCQAERFDLNIRTDRPLTVDLRRELRALYAAAGDAAGLVGEIRFRPGAWADLPDPGGTRGPGTGITV